MKLLVEAVRSTQPENLLITDDVAGQSSCGTEAGIDSRTLANQPPVWTCQLYGCPDPMNLGILPY